MRQRIPVCRIAAEMTLQISRCTRRYVILDSSGKVRLAKDGDTDPHLCGLMISEDPENIAAGLAIHKRPFVCRICGAHKVPCTCPKRLEGYYWHCLLYASCPHTLRPETADDAAPPSAGD